MWLLLAPDPKQKKKRREMNKIDCDFLSSNSVWLPGKTKETQRVNLGFVNS